MFLMDQKVICLSCSPRYPLLMLTAAALSLRQCPAAGPHSDYCHCPRGLMLDPGAPRGVFSVSAPGPYISRGSRVAGETAEGAVTLWGQWQVSVLVLQQVVSGSQGGICMHLPWWKVAALHTWGGVWAQPCTPGVGCGHPGLLGARGGNGFWGARSAHQRTKERSPSHAAWRFIMEKNVQCGRTRAERKLTRWWSLSWVEREEAWLKHKTQWWGGHICPTDTSCGNVRLLLSWTPTSLWLCFISIPE